MIKINELQLFLILFIKIIFLVSFSSEYLDGLFYPFLTSISLDNLNPWQYYYERNLLDSFPYHSLMFYILAPFALLGELMGGGNY